MKNEEVVATRKTFDGVTVYFHANGEMSSWSHYFRGRIPVGMIFRVAEDVCLYTSAEIPALIKAVNLGNFRGFRVRFPAPSSAVYESRLMANGMEVFFRVR